MVNYPNGKKKAYTSKPTSAGGRGMVLEKDINVTNMFYLSIDKAVIHKKPTPVTIVKVDYPARSAAKITEAYFKLPSTTDSIVENISILRQRNALLVPLFL